MSLLLPLGLLGLLSILVLIIIYIIKPNFQQKFISSTYVWKLSLKYKRRRISTNKLRNIILIICQVLVLTLLAFVLAQPAKSLFTNSNAVDVAVVVDASSSMRTEIDGETRFERAVAKAKEKAEKSFSQNGTFSLILATADPVLYYTRVTRESENIVYETLDSFVNRDNDNQDLLCSYGSADLDGAMSICETIVSQNPSVQVSLITDSTVVSVPSGVEVISVADENSNEWNAGILNATAELNDGYYMITVEVATYGRSEAINLAISVSGANVDQYDSVGSTIDLKETVYCEDGVTKTIIFKSTLEEEDVSGGNTTYVEMSENRMFSFKSIRIYIDGIADNYSVDDNFYIYGGEKEIIKIQYYSSLPNTFFQSILNVIRNNYSDDFDIKVTFVKSGDSPEMTGFDYYIFEHNMPETLPEDGVVFLVDPESAPRGSGLIYLGYTNYDNDVRMSDVSEGDSIMDQVDATNITVRRIQRVRAVDSAYKTLMEVDGNPMLFYKDESNSKVIVMSFSVHYSNLPLVPEFPLLMFHLFDKFFPAMLDGNAFNVSDTITITRRGVNVTVTDPSGEYVYNDADNGDNVTGNVSFVADTYGPYIVQQTTFSGKVLSQSFFVRTPAEESNIFRQIESLSNPYVNKERMKYYNDLLVYFAAALTLLLFVEWWLQSRENM